MNTETTIPANIEAIIQKKEFELQERHRIETEEKNRKKQEAEEQAKKTVGTHIMNLLEKQIPQWLHPFLNTTDHEPDYERIANGWDRVENIDLFFSISGLSELQFDPRKGSWRAAEAHQGRLIDFEDEYSDPYMTFRDAYWRDDLEYVLLRAKAELADYQGFVELANTWKAERETRRQAILEVEKRQAEREEQQAREREAREEKQRSEEQALFDAIKNDDIAIHLLKAFVLLRDERSNFEQRLNDADENLYSIEERWSRKAADLRRQAEDADRRAADEKARIQSDLDDAESKLKKATRGW